MQRDAPDAEIAEIMRKVLHVVFGSRTFIRRSRMFVLCNVKCHYLHCFVAHSASFDELMKQVMFEAGCVDLKTNDSKQEGHADDC